MKTTFTLIIVVLLVQLSVRGEIFKPAVYGAGSMTCEKWTALKTAEPLAPHYVQLSWVEGFVTALHNYTQNFKTMDRAAIDPWITNYCQRHPNDTIAKAATSLTVELVDTKR